MKEDFTDNHIAEFLRRSYFVVDGLWFLKTEEKRGFDEAMARDEAVWGVMAKVQARKAKELLGITGDSVHDLAKAFQLKLAAEGHEFEVDLSETEARFEITVCPWHETLKTSRRTSIAQHIAERICALEYAVWAKEFSPDIEFEMNGRLCVESDGCETCRFAVKKGI